MKSMVRFSRRAHDSRMGIGVLWHAVNLGRLLAWPATAHIHARLNTISNCTHRELMHIWRARGPENGRSCFHGYISLCHSSQWGTITSFRGKGEGRDQEGHCSLEGSQNAPTLQMLTRMRTDVWLCYLMSFDGRWSIRPHRLSTGGDRLIGSFAVLMETTWKNELYNTGCYSNCLIGTMGIFLGLWNIDYIGALNLFLYPEDIVFQDCV